MKLGAVVDQVPDEEWEAVERLFQAAVDLDPSAREAFLADASGGDERLLERVRSLLRAAPESGRRLSAAIARTAGALAAEVATSRVGERVGPYRLLSQLGQGGMGTIYLAERADGQYRARVAIKFVRGVFAAPDLERRFLAERQILADLSHPFIARLLDGGAMDDGTPYLVMELLDADPIHTWCDARGLGAGDRVSLFLKVCDAVAYAHRSRIVHRDLKPSNIVVTSDGTPKLLDFGIATLLDKAVSAQQTMASRILTPAYASPEQVRGESVTPAADVYSLGCVLYTLLAGRPPFNLRGATAGEVERRVCREKPPPPSEAADASGVAWAREVTGELDAVVLKALRKRPRDRHPSIEALANDLRRCLSSAPASGISRLVRHHLRHRLRRVGRRPAVAAGTLGVMGAAALASFIVNDSLHGRPFRLDRFEYLPVQEAPAVIPTPYDVRVADVDGNEQGDLIWNHLASGVNVTYVGLGTPDGSFELQVPVTHPAIPVEGWANGFEFLVGDFDGDGRDDGAWYRATGGGENRVYVALSKGDGSFRFLDGQTLGRQRGDEGLTIHVGDLTGTGADDLVHTHLTAQNDVLMMPSLGDGTFGMAASTTHPARGWTGYRAFVVDVDADGRADVVFNDVPTYANRTYVARTRGEELRVLPWHLLLSQNHPDSIDWSPYTTHVGDIDGDGHGDLIWLASGADPIAIHRALGQPSAEVRFLEGQQLPRPAGAGPLTEIVGDFNGDGRSDIAWYDLRHEAWHDDAPLPRLWVTLGDRNGTFGEIRQVRRSVDQGAGAVQAGTTEPVRTLVLDVDGDGRDDVVWAVLGETTRIYVALSRPPGS